MNIKLKAIIVNNLVEEAINKIWSPVFRYFTETTAGLSSYMRDETGGGFLLE